MLRNRPSEGERQRHTWDERQSISRRWLFYNTNRRRSVGEETDHDMSNSNYNSHELQRSLEQVSDRVPEQAPEQARIPKAVKDRGGNEQTNIFQCDFHLYYDICLYFWYVLFITCVAILGVTFAISHFTDNNNINSSDYSRGITDPVTGQTISAYKLPIRPDPILISDQDELDLIRTTLSNHSLLSDMASSIPNTVEVLLSACIEGCDAYPSLLAATWLLNNHTTNAQEEAVQLFALATLYYSTGGANWINNTNWLSHEYYCNWYGVTCCEDAFGSNLCKPGDYGHIIEIDLFRNNVTGRLPPVLALFPYLQSLYLSENNISGNIPGAALGSLQHLVKLWLSYNSLTGTIPIELHRNSILSTMYVQGNDLTGKFPTELLSCPECRNKLINFGVDCGKVSCRLEQCYENCFYS